MNEIEIFKNSEFGQVRTITIKGEPWFIGKDIADILGYSNQRDAINKHVYDEDKGVAKCDTLGGMQELTVINESGLYSLILSSKMHNAKRFKRWVTSEVLPAIRKHGMYAKEELLENPDLLIEVAVKLKQERDERRRLEKENKEMKPKAVFADAVKSSSTSILIGDLAKLLKQNGYETGPKRLFERLRNEGYLIKSGVSKNMPTQKSMEKGLFEVKEATIVNPDDRIRITKTTKVTGEGQVYFINRYLNKN